MRIATYNIQHGMSHRQRIIDGNAPIDLPLMIGVIKELAPDVSGLNEVYGQGAYPEFNNQPKVIGDALGYESRFARAIDFDENGDGTKKPYGNGLVSKYPIIETEIIPIPKGNDDDPGYKEPRCILKTVIDCDGRDLCVMTVHVGLTKQEKGFAIERICKALDSTELPTVLMGDFNMTPDDELLKPVYERMFDTAELISDDLKSFPSDKPEIKIDYIFTRGVKVLSADIPQICAADHCPYIVDIEF